MNASIVKNDLFNGILWLIVSLASFVIAVSNPAVGWITFGVLVISAVIIFRGILLLVVDRAESKRRKLDKLGNPLV